MKLPWLQILKLHIAGHWYPLTRTCILQPINQKGRPRQTARMNAIIKVVKSVVAPYACLANMIRNACGILTSGQCQCLDKDLNIAHQLLSWQVIMTSKTSERGKKTGESLIIVRREVRRTRKWKSVQNLQLKMELSFITMIWMFPCLKRNEKHWIVPNHSDRRV